MVPVFADNRFLVPTELALVMPSQVHHVLTDTPELAAATMVWLTAEKRDWLAGRYIDCTWDMEAFLQKKEEVVERDLLKVKLMV